MITLNVADIYQGDRVTSFAKARAAGLLGVIHKASTGQTGRDTQYAARRQAALDAGLLWGAYHWGTARPVKDQVANFLDCAKPDATTLVALDYESDPGNQMTLAQAREFLTLIEQQLGRKAVLYSGNLAKEQLGSKPDAFFGSHRLWLPQYGPAPHVQASWTKPWLWQYTDGTSASAGPTGIDGIPGNTEGKLDCNFYDGTAAQLAAEWAV